MRWWLKPSVKSVGGGVTTARIDSAFLSGAPSLREGRDIAPRGRKADFAERDGERYRSHCPPRVVAESVQLAQHYGRAMSPIPRPTRREREIRSSKKTIVMKNSEANATSALMVLARMEVVRDCASADQMPGRTLMRSASYHRRAHARRPRGEGIPFERATRTNSPADESSTGRVSSIGRAKQTSLPALPPKRTAASR